MPLHINRLNRYIYDIPDLPGVDIETLKHTEDHDEIVIDENYKTVVKQLCRAIAICHTELIENKNIAKNTSDNYNKYTASTKGSLTSSSYNEWYDNVPEPFDRASLIKNKLFGAFGLTKDADSGNILSIESINNLVSYIDGVINAPDSPWKSILSNKYTVYRHWNSQEARTITSKYMNSTVPLMTNVPKEDIKDGKLINFNDQVFINIIRNLMQVNIYLNQMNSALWAFDGTCKLSCQVACQATCQIACQNCQYDICHNQNCGGWS